ncbi:hypothetical protein GDI3865 (plasmid) [Gluconacetobacter diazotrophicus PA1 5]|uniref:Uncharacterized protein n=1 Tax=Gluconacetobacter diazotrophicus (strain ATCC 49037 / DSM 5601 / CCUG 37298 / CIP 103539 / LMG 7603 / PAl5) TaxID=272568 RepID=A9HSS7_GLUDA|nr:hypothetical protein GDI3865 [Gluconacetobacter diazotrophicus PA1 5]
MSWSEDRPRAAWLAALRTRARTRTARQGWPAPHVLFLFRPATKTKEEGKRGRKEGEQKAAASVFGEPQGESGLTVARPKPRLHLAGSSAPGCAKILNLEMSGQRPHIIGRPRKRSSDCLAGATRPGRASSLLWGQGRRVQHTGAVTLQGVEGVNQGEHIAFASGVCAMQKGFCRLS